MKISQINWVHFSPAGTTKQIAEAMARALGGSLKEYDLLRQPPPAEFSLGADSLSVFAFPVYAGRIPRICAEMLLKFKGQGGPAIALVAYGNREYDDALLELRDILEATGFKVVAAAAFIAQHSIFPRVAAGRPDVRDLENIKVFAGRCQELLADWPRQEALQVPGNFPYKQGGGGSRKPKGDDKCIDCGACVEICPTGAIAAATPRETDAILCMSCMACVNVCPTDARQFKGGEYEASQEAFWLKNAARKEPEFFFIG